MDFSKTIKTLKLLSVVTLVGSASLSANAAQDEDTGLYYSAYGTTCTIVAPTDGTTYTFEEGDVVIPSTVTYNGKEYQVTDIDARAFFNCTSLKSVTMPESVKQIGTCCFYGCTNLGRVNITNLEAWCGIYFGDYYSNPICNGGHLYLNGNDIIELVIPDGITEIKQYAFYGGSSFTSVTISDSVTSIGMGAFQYCKGLTSVTLSQNLKSTGVSAFYGCTSLASVTFPESITTISDSSFRGCSALTSIKIPDNIEIIEGNAFASCTSLKYLDLGEGVKTIGTQAFMGCILKGTNTNQFTGAYLNVLIIPNSVETIGDGAFCHNGSLENIWIGNGCESIGNAAFQSCGNLQTVSCMAYPAPIIKARTAFDEIDYTNAYLYIYEGDENTEYSDVYDSYADKENNYWYLFLKGISVGVDEVVDEDIAVTTDGMAIEINGYEGEICIYNVAGIKVYQGSSNKIEMDNPGIYVIVINGKCYKVAIK